MIGETTEYVMVIKPAALRQTSPHGLSGMSAYGGLSRPGSTELLGKYGKLIEKTTSNGDLVVQVYFHFYPSPVWMSCNDIQSVTVDEFLVGLIMDT